MDVLDNEGEELFPSIPLKPQLPINNNSVYQKAKANPNNQQVNNHYQNVNGYLVPKSNQNQIYSQK
jgi:hypothetical protein